MAFSAQGWNNSCFYSLLNVCLSVKVFRQTCNPWSRSEESCAQQMFLIKVRIYGCGLETWVWHGDMGEMFVPFLEQKSQRDSGSWLV